MNIRLDSESLTLSYCDHIVRVTPSQFAVLRVLAGGGATLYESLYEEVIRCRGDGGPSRASLGVMLTYLRKKLRPIGLEITRACEDRKPRHIQLREKL